MAWMIYMADQGVWEADSATVEELVNDYMKSVIDYGVACCHHTCKNLAWNSKIIQASSLTPSQKQKFAEILAQATNTEPLYQMEEESSNDGESGNSSDGNSKRDALVNGTSEEKSDSSQEGGNTAVGNQPGESGNAKVASSSQSSQSASSESAGANAYELDKKSASKSVSSAESNMPIFVIFIVIILIGIFLVGYLRDQNDDEY